jgi:hypothetical protein
MKLQRRKATGTTKASYPTHEEAKSDRRSFLSLLGRGLVAAPLLGMAGCEFAGKKKGPADAGADVLGEPDYTLGGVAPDGIGVEPDTGPDSGPDWNLSGGAPMDPDLRTPPDEDYQVAGDLGSEVQAPDLKPQPDAAEEDVPPLAGDMPAPDVTTPSQQDAKGEVDAEEPPLDGDMPAPSF